MTHVEGWQRIAARIRGLIQAGHLHAQLTGSRTDSYGASRGLRQQCEIVLTELQAFVSTYSESLPGSAKACINAFVTKHSDLIRSEPDVMVDVMQGRVAAALVFLASFEAEMAFLLNDAQEAIRVRSERAFAHLQRMIVADGDTRAKWQAAYIAGETECEKLGAVRLLAHGIFAFKAYGAGERTDLVYQDRHGALREAERYVEGLTLTEWKVCRDPRTSGRSFEAARKQAERYGRGVLGGAELAGYRYAVVVSEEELVLPSDVLFDGVQHRHINIATKPRTPSRAVLS